MNLQTIFIFLVWRSSLILAMLTDDSEEDDLCHTIRTEKSNFETIENFPTWYCNSLYVAQSLTLGQFLLEGDRMTFFEKCCLEMVPDYYFKTENGKNETPETISDYIIQIVVSNRLQFSAASDLIIRLCNEGYNMTAVTSLCKGSPNYCQNPLVEVPLNVLIWNELNSGKIDFYPCADVFYKPKEDMVTIAKKLSEWSKPQNYNRCTCRDYVILNSFFVRIRATIQKQIFSETYFQMFEFICSIDKPRWWSGEQLAAIVNPANNLKLEDVIKFMQYAYPVAKVFKAGISPNWNSRNILNCAKYFEQEAGSLVNAFKFLRAVMGDLSLMEVRRIFRITETKLTIKNLAPVRIQLIKFISTCRGSKLRLLDAMEEVTSYYQMYYIKKDEGVTIT